MIKPTFAEGGGGGERGGGVEGDEVCDDARGVIGKIDSVVGGLLLAADVAGEMLLVLTLFTGLICCENALDVVLCC